MNNESKTDKKNMTSGKLWDKILFFALPVAATAILGQLFNLADVAVVGNFTGDLKTIAVAAVGANGPVIGLIVNFFIGISLGSNVVISRAVGKGDDETVTKAVHTSIALAVVGGILMMVLGELIAPEVLKLLNVPDNVFPYALDYLRIYLSGLPVILLYNFEAAIFRSIGKTRIPLVALTVSGIINVVFNLIFVIVFDLNVKGVAIATVTSNAISSVILSIILLRTNSVIKVRLQKIRFDKESLASIIKIGLPSGGQNAVFSISNIVIQSAINSLGDTVMAASSAAFNIEIIAYYVISSFAQACTTFTGQNNGASKHKRCLQSYCWCLIESMIATLASVGLTLLIGKPLLSLFDNDPEVIKIGYTRLVIVFSSYLFCMLYEVTAGYLRGYGISFTPALITTICVCVVRILWINFVFPLYNTFAIIMIAYPVSLFLTSVCMLIALAIFHPSKKNEKLLAASSVPITVEDGESL